MGHHAPGLPLLRAGLAAALAAGIAGCAGLGSNGPEAAPLPQGVSVQAASTAVAPGQTKDEVRARLGPGIEIKFDSGYEVWAYRGAASRESGARNEFVVLFEPSGTVKKTRIRLAEGVASR